MKVLVCGGRDYDNFGAVRKTLDALHRDNVIDMVIHGGANGADYLAGVWARINDVDSTTVEANWSKHGRRAGPIRNQKMLDDHKPDLVVAFPGGAGTSDMVRRAELQEFRVMRIEDDRSSFT